MKTVKNYICIVDGYRRASRQRNTAGRYRVGAKTKKEAKLFLQSVIGFGSIQVYYEDTDPKTCQLARYGECLQEQPNTGVLTPAQHATMVAKENS